MIVLVGQSILLVSSLNLCFNICLLSLILWHMPLLTLAPVPLGILYKDWKAAARSPHSLPFLQAEQAPLPHTLLRARPPAPTTSVALQNPGSSITSLNWEDQNRTQSYKCDLLGAEQKGIILSLDAALLFTQTRMLLAVSVAGGCGWFMSSLLFTRTSGPFWQGCSSASAIAVLKACNNCLVYLNTDYKKNRCKKSAEAPKPCVQRLQPRFVLKKTRILHMSLCELVAWNRSLSLISPPSEQKY